MGWFGKKQEKSNAASSAAVDGAYVDIENLPVAVAVATQSPPPPFAPAARDAAVAPMPLAQQQQQQQQQQSPQQKQDGSSPFKGTVVTAPPVLVTASNTTVAPGGQLVQFKSSAAAAAASAAPFQNLIFSREPSFLNPCMHCGRNCRTRVVTSPNLLTWLAVVGLLFVFWPLCWLPLVFNCTRESRHYCTNCHQYIGTIQPFQDCCTKTRG